jgi:homoserine O-acetyltransferase/O-succinyltransferase
MATAFRHPPLKAGQIDRTHERWQAGDFILESGEVIQDFELSYVTHGELNEARDNAVLVTVSLTGNHHRLDFLIGPQRALDPRHDFIICVDPIGNGLSSSPSNSARQPGARFPRFILRDMVHSQYQLLSRHLGIPSVRAIVGASMGGMQALQWGVSYPAFANALVAMTAMACCAPWAIAVVDTARHALMADEAWNGSEFTAYPTRGWRAWTGVMSVLAGRTPAALAEMFPNPADVLDWIGKVADDNRSNGFDALDWLYQTYAYEAHDVGTTPSFSGDLAKALGTVNVPTLLLSPALDIFNPSECADEALRHLPNAQRITIPTVQGHQGASSTSNADAAFLNKAILAFLAA